jgi:hypothetical protein
MLISISSILIVIILLFCILIIGIEIYSIYNIEYIDKEILNNANESLKNIENNNECNISKKRTIFSTFIELFNADCVPSKFVSKHINEIPVLKTVSLNQDINTNTITNCISNTTMLNYYKLDNEVYKLSNDLYKLSIEYYKLSNEYYKLDNEQMKNAINDVCRYASEALGKNI